jgi:hypothetical protein
MLAGPIYVGTISTPIAVSGVLARPQKIIGYAPEAVSASVRSLKVHANLTSPLTGGIQPNKIQAKVR